MHLCSALVSPSKLRRTVHIAENTSGRTPHPAGDAGIPSSITSRILGTQRLRGTPTRQRRDIQLVPAVIRTHRSCVPLAHSHLQGRFQA